MLYELTFAEVNMPRNGENSGFQFSRERIVAGSGILQKA